MSTSLDAVRNYVAALRAPDENAVRALDDQLSDDVAVIGTLGAAAGKEAVLSALKNLPSPRLLAGASWSEPEFDSATVRMQASLAEGLPIAGLSLLITIDGDGKIARIAQRPIPGPPPPLTGLVLTAEIKSSVNGALANGTPIVLAYVDPEGAPHLSFRGSTQAWSDDQLAIWVRDPEGGLLRAIDVNPQVALLYRDPSTRQSYQFAGRAHLETEPAVRARVYANSPAVERNMDAQERGVALIIDLDRVEGVSSTGRFRMHR